MTPPSKIGLDAFETLRRYLKELGWDAEEADTPHAFRARKELDICPCTYYFQIKPDLEQFLFYIAPEVTLLTDMLPGVAEYVARANLGMRIGNFELDYRGCRVSFRSGLNFRGVPLSGMLIDNAIAPALTAFDEFFPGLVKVIAGISTPSAAIFEIEYGGETDA